MQCSPCPHSRNSFSQECWSPLHFHQCWHPVGNREKLFCCGYSLHVSVSDVIASWLTYKSGYLVHMKPTNAWYISHHWILWLMHGHQPWWVSRISRNVYCRPVLLKLYCVHETRGHRVKMQTLIQQVWIWSGVSGQLRWCLLLLVWGSHSHLSSKVVESYFVNGTQVA